ncbi:MAG TPA: RiPP maturation radical SAM C-methyltransferase [Pyrinomonadaceae bacterium]|nr:RiPP maturation radical SAM C-methyltransferase [Pyrinomonadaceae bacterium]
MEREFDVALVNMPFGSLQTPSIGLSLLQASLGRFNICSHIFYFTFRFAELIGPSTYSRITTETHSHDLVGEWIFSPALFPGRSNSELKQYVVDVLDKRLNGSSQACAYLRPLPGDFVNEIVSAGGKVEGFLTECLEKIAECAPAVVGFTSVFQQQLSSLSLAKRIKERCPDTLVVFGGANCEGVMGVEMIRQFAFIDAVVSGEGEAVFPELVRRVLGGQPFSDLEGVYSRSDSTSTSLDQPIKNSPVITAMDSLANPDYTDYFVQLEQTKINGMKPSLLFETSRGCWWGAKHHCTFCGLNGETMVHRRKSPARALAELADLTRRHPGLDVVAVDNILDMAYFKDFLPALAKMRAETNLEANLFYEVKSNLTKPQLRLLKQAGVNEVQPGIESLSNRVLKIMRKGVKGLQNIQFLKWCAELDIQANWNFIWGFPGEPPEEYGRMADLVPFLTHLQPPQYATTIRVDRFSPNFTQHKQLGLKNLMPYPAYSYVYSLPPEALTNLAYYFTFEYSEQQEVESDVTPLVMAIEQWQQCHRHSRLYWMEVGERLMIWDRRPVAESSLILLTGLQRSVYKLCDQIATPRQLLERIRSFGESTTKLELADVRVALEHCTARGIMIEQDDCYLSLAIPAPTNSAHS